MSWLYEPVEPAEDIDGLDKVTRFEVIDSSHRVLVRYGLTYVRAQLQDGGRTLKVFLLDEFEDNE